MKIRYHFCETHPSLIIFPPTKGKRRLILPNEEDKFSIIFELPYLGYSIRYDKLPPVKKLTLVTQNAATTLLSQDLSRTAVIKVQIRHGTIVRATAALDKSLNQNLIILFDAGFCHINLVLKFYHK